MDEFDFLLLTFIIGILGGMIYFSVLCPILLIFFVPIILFVCLATWAASSETEDQSNKETSECEEQSDEEVAEPEEQANEEVSKADDKIELWVGIIAFSLIAIILTLSAITHSP
jgi:uncharacterized membrane protein